MATLYEGCFTIGRWYIRRYEQLSSFFKNKTNLGATYSFKEKMENSKNLLS